MFFLFLRSLKIKKALKNRHVNVLVVVPTRELAIQVEEVFNEFGNSLPFPFKSKAVFWRSVNQSTDEVDEQHKCSCGNAWAFY